MSSDKDAKFKAWLVLKGGVAVTAVPGDKAWNRAVAESVSKTMKAKDKK